MGVFSVLDKSRVVAPREFNRWLIPPAALAVHLSIGQIYAFSVFKSALVERFDASLTQIGFVFSIAIVVLGLSAAFGGTWVERAGPRKAMVLSALFWSSGFVIGAIAVASGQLWLLYLGVGVIGGIGLGIGYISPVSTLIKWFPDRPGMATGLAIMGFGGGALIASPMAARLLERFGHSPSGAIIPTFLVMAGIDFVVILLGAATIRTPHPQWRPAGWVPPEKPKSTLMCLGCVTAHNALRTPQFWLLWLVLFCNITAGIGILEQAALMVQDFYPATTAAMAAGFVGILSLSNMAGRFGWSSLSDLVGRKRIYMMYLGGGAIVYLLLAEVGTRSIGIFVLFAAVILSFYGGGFATIPAYIKDIFGDLQVSAIHGRVLTAWSAAGIAGPLIVNRIADHETAAGRAGADLYKTSLLVMVGVLTLGFVANLLVRRVDERYCDPVPVVVAEPAVEAVPGVLAVGTVPAPRTGMVRTLLAAGLGVIVVSGLVYGLTQTVIKAVALFS